jgi:hypothetical protein
VLQIYQLEERAGRGSCTLAVDRLDQHIAKLDALGIDTTQRTHDDKVDTVMIVDPDNNHLAFAEARDASVSK